MRPSKAGIERAPQHAIALIEVPDAVPGRSSERHLLLTICPRHQNQGLLLWIPTVRLVLIRLADPGNRTDFPEIKTRYAQKAE